MKPEKILIDYMQDMHAQIKNALKHNNVEDAKKIQEILEDFKSAVQLLNFWRSNYKHLKIVSKKDAV